MGDPVGTWCLCTNGKWVPTMWFREVPLQTHIGMQVGILHVHLGLETHVHLHIPIKTWAKEKERHEKQVHSLISINTHTHSHTVLTDWLLEGTAWIKLLVKESRASWQIKNDCSVCCSTREKRERRRVRVRWRKREHARAVWLCISLTKARGGLEKQHQPRLAQRGLQCNHF